MGTGVQNFLMVALPIMVTLVATVWTAQWSQNKRFEDLSKRIDDLRSDMAGRMDDMAGRIDDLRSDMTRRIDDFRSDMNARFGEVTTRLGRIESKLDEHEKSIVTLEERTSPFRR